MTKTTLMDAPSVAEERGYSVDVLIVQKSSNLESPPGWPWWCAWIAANSISETLGLGSIALLAFWATTSLGEPSTTGGVLIAALLAVIVGAGEGAGVGAAQFLVLRRRLPRLGPWSWIAATATGAAAAWFLGMIPSTIASLSESPQSTGGFEPTAVLVLSLSIVLGLIGGMILSFPQWRVLRRHIDRAGWWILANMVAWAAAMPLIFLPIQLVSPEKSVVVNVTIILAAIALAGAVAGGIHGVFLLKLLRFKR